MSLLAQSPSQFQTFLRIAASSVAEPPWFAPPVEAEEDAETITFAFHVPWKKAPQVRVEVRDQSIALRAGPSGGRTEAVRHCTLPCPILSTRFEATRAGELLCVRVPKGRPATPTKGAPP